MTPEAVINTLDRLLTERAKFTRTLAGNYPAPSTQATVWAPIGLQQGTTSDNVPGTQDTQDTVQAVASPSFTDYNGWPTQEERRAFVTGDLCELHGRVYSVQSCIPIWRNGKLVRLNLVLKGG